MMGGMPSLNINNAAGRLLVPGAVSSVPSLNDDERRDVLSEVSADELKLIAEYVKDVPLVKRKIDALEVAMQAVKSDIYVISAAVTDISRQHNDDQRRLTRPTLLSAQPTLSSQRRLGSNQ